LVVEVPNQTATVRLWQATNPNARDFRLETIGKAWTSTDLAPSSDGTYIVRLSPPAQGWTAFLVEATFEYGDRPVPLKLTTPVKVLPGTKPFKFKPKPHPR
jgi:PhoPQ-activated pathogenicity-related protein